MTAAAFGRTPMKATIPNNDRFLNLLMEADELVKKTFPAAEFLVATRRGQTDAPYQFIFNIPAKGGKANTTAILYHDEKKGFVLPPEHINAPWVGVRVTPLPIDLGLIEAEKIAKNFGFNPPYTEFSLSWVLAPAVNEPYYAFTNEKGVCFVGVFTKHPTTAPIRIELPLHVTV